MNKEQIMKRKEPKNIVIHIRITNSMSKWLSKENLSPTSIFYEAMKELGYLA